MQSTFSGTRYACDAPRCDAVEMVFKGSGNYGGFEGTVRDDPSMMDGPEWVACSFEHIGPAVMEALGVVLEKKIAQRELS